MAENSLKLVPIDLNSMKPLLKEVVKNFQDKDREEVCCYIKDKENMVEHIASVLDKCQEKNFVYSGNDIIGIAACQTLEYDSLKIGCLCVLTTNLVKKHAKDYFICGKRFVNSLIKKHDMVVCEIMSDYESSMKMSKKLGFSILSREKRNGKDFSIKILKGVKNGLD